MAWFDPHKQIPQEGDTIAIITLGETQCIKGFVGKVVKNFDGELEVQPLRKNNTPAPLMPIPFFNLVHSPEKFVYRWTYFDEEMDEEIIDKAFDVCAAHRAYNFFFRGIHGRTESDRDLAVLLEEMPDQFIPVKKYGLPKDPDRVYVVYCGKKLHLARLEDMNYTVISWMPLPPML